jgi:SAM-dependent methyltransferase
MDAMRVRIGHATYRVLFTLWRKTLPGRVANVIVERLPTRLRRWIEERKARLREEQQRLHLLRNRGTHVGVEFEAGPTVAEGWERYALKFDGSKGRFLGDQWDRPEAVGIDGIEHSQFVAYIDEKVISPFLGACDVLLEIGPGGGRFTEVLLPKCNRLIAVDTSPAMLRLLRQRFGSGKIEYILGGKDLSPIPDQSVDAAFSYQVFNILQHWDIFNYLCELRRVLRPGGRAIIHTANTFSELGWERFVREVPLSLSVHKLPGTFTVMTPQIIQEFVERAELQLVAALTDVVPRDCICQIRR